MRNPALTRRIPSELEDELIMTYLNSFKIYENIYYYTRDLFFNQLIPNPLPNIINIFQTKNLYYQLYEMNNEYVILYKNIIHWGQGWGFIILFYITSHYNNNIGATKHHVNGDRLRPNIKRPRDILVLNPRYEIE